MKTHTCEQKTGEWMQLHIGRVTASEAHNIMTTDFEERKGEMPKTYLYRKAAEGFRGESLPGFSSWSTEQGQELEYEARKWYVLQTDERVRQVGFCEHDDSRCGCSPDGLVGDDGGVEIKAPEPTNQVRYVCEGRLPLDYIVQVHFSLYVTGRKWWDFVSYSRRLPKFLLRVHRDEEICAKIGRALGAFYSKYDTVIENLRKK